MEKNEMMLKIGTYAFIIGIIIALLVGIVHASTLEAIENEEDVEAFFATDEGGFAAWALAVIGAIIGILAAYGKGTITAKETPGFLLAGIGLLIIGRILIIF